MRFNGSIDGKFKKTLQIQKPRGWPGAFFLEIELVAVSENTAIYLWFF